MQFEFRNATAEDFKVIAAFPQNEEESFFMFPSGKYPLTGEQLEEAAAKRFSPTVILHDGEVVGYSNFYGVQNGVDCWLGNAIVHPNYRRSGVGSYLIETMKNRALNEYAVKELKLVCHHTNTSALLFYHKNAFKPFDWIVMQNQNGDKVVGIKMSISLESLASS
ncbi:MAG: hypothetical protein K0Q59_4268 [Paenibacillus sp.]|jgi:ribosomal protein S18 acetylase RimI-like enzyme|nr:hypothetical protein [Paenibacillus sp.]